MIGRAPFPIYARWVRWFLLVMTACATATAVQPPPRPELFVDGSAPDDGDGTREHPLRAPIGRSGYVVHVASGVYSAPVALPADVELVGDGEVVLHAERDVEAVVQGAGAHLRHVTVQGGRWGVISDDGVELTDVSFSGQREGGVLVRTGTARLKDVRIEGTLPDTVGVQARKDTRVSIDGATFTGALKRAIDSDGASVTAMNVKSTGPAQVVHAVGGKTVLRDVSAKGGSGPAFYVAAGTLELERCDVTGHEYGVLVGEGAHATLTGVRSERAQLSAVSVVQADAVIRDLVVLSPGSHGALEALASTVRVDGLRVTDATDQAVLIRKGSAWARGVTVTRLRGDPGDAVNVRDASVTLEHVTATDVEGAGVGVTSVAEAIVSDVQCTRCGHGALVVDRRSHDSAKHIRSDRSPAVVAGDDASVELEDVQAPGEGPLVWAECEGTTKVTVHGLPKSDRLSGACVDVK
jgi:hypothetical protein